MKIRSLTLKNIGVFENETIHFPEKKVEGAEIHILTGQNGTGKTTILQALANMVRAQLNLIVDETFNKLSKKSTKEDNYCRVTYDTNLGQHQRFIDLFDINPVKKVDDYNDWNQQIYSFGAFAYSGYRFIEHQEGINITEKYNYHPLEKALQFNKGYEFNEYSLNEWLALTIAKRNNAFFEGIESEVKKYSQSVDNLKKIISDIIEIPIDFKFKNEKAKVVAVRDGLELDFDLLPDGLRSIISWLGDLIMRMDALKWKDDLPLFEREFILFLDEIEVHLHPYWQRKILPVIQKKFKNAQIFITTHSPFIVNSVDGAWIYELKLDEKGNCHCEEPQLSSTVMPIDEVLKEIYDIDATQMYGQPIEKEIEDFRSELEKAYERNNTFDKPTFLKKAKRLAQKSVELRNNVQFELRQLSNSLEEEFKI